jgi:predicted O-methyltransferase YrrM
MKNLLHCVLFLLNIHEPYSQVTTAELDALKRYLPLRGVIVELGCYEGKTSVELASIAQSQVYSVDPFFPGRLGISYQYIIARVHAYRRGVKNLTLLRTLSWNAIDYVDRVDFLFIDADHSYEAVTRDFEAWLPKLQNNGVVAMHDAFISPNSPSYIGSMKYYDENIKENDSFELLESVDSLAILRYRR